jgi:hypothetical protein
MPPSGCKKADTINGVYKENFKFNFNGRIGYRSNWQWACQAIATTFKLKCQWPMSDEPLSAPWEK